MPPRALLIDAMGTLVHLADPVPHLRAALGRRLGVAVDDARAAAAMRAEFTHYRAHMAGGRDPAAVRALRRDCAGVLGRALGIDAAPATLVPVLLDALRFRAYPDAVPALTRARAAGMRVVVVSNWDASLPEALAAAGLAGSVDAVIASAAVGAAKPHVAIFRAALARAGVVAEHALHVGDTAGEDIVGARAAGIPALLLRRPDAGGVPAPPGTRVIDSLDALRWPAPNLDPR